MLDVYVALPFAFVTSLPGSASHPNPSESFERGSDPFLTAYFRQLSVLITGLISLGHKSMMGTKYAVAGKESSTALQRDCARCQNPRENLKKWGYFDILPTVRSPAHYLRNYLADSHLDNRARHSRTELEWSLYEGVYGFRHLGIVCSKAPDAAISIISL